jgi:hypothetical protein
MKSIKIAALTILLSIVFSTNLQAQFFKKLQKKIDRKIEQVINPDEKESEDNAGDVSENTSNKKNENYRKYDDFITGETTIFFDDLSGNEAINQHPSRWKTTFANAKDNSEIIMYKGEKVIRLGSRQGISPIISENTNDYLPDSFTLEFDASFSANAIDQRYYVQFFDLENQNDIVEYETRGNQITLTTFGVTDNLTEGTLKGHEYYEKSPTLVWRHIAISYQNNTLEVYYDGKHLFHKGDTKGNLIGVTISRSELSGNDRYLKNIIIATN